MIFSRSLGILPIFLALLLVTACATPQVTTVDAPAAERPEAPGQVATVYDDPDLVRQYQEMITPEGLASYLFVLASDYFEGRETGMRGQKLAAAYLAGQYRKLGIQPRGTVEPHHEYAPEAYYQRFDLHGHEIVRAELSVMHANEQVAQSTFTKEQPDGHSYLQFGDLPNVSGGVVFGGYGIMDDDLEYNDYVALQNEGISPAGQWLMVLDAEPLADAETSLLGTDDGAPSRWTQNRMNKYRPALSAGARGILIVGDVRPGADDVGTQASQHAIRMQHSIGSLSLEPGEAGANYPPIYVISSELADQILAPTGRTVTDLQQQIDTTLEPEVLRVDGVTVNGQLENVGFDVETENVVAFIEGTDPELRDEVVVFTAHYDHLGVDPTLDNPVFNGADDDGSGTVALLKLAEAFQQAKDDGHGPRRSLVFLSVTAEEKGLLGSAYYTDYDPIFPLEDTVANFNLDMISRSDPTREGDTDYVYIIGSRIISDDLDEILEDSNELTGINMTLDHRFNTPDDPNQFFRRSDQWNFGKHNIPFIFYFTGTHEDYHQPGDEPHRVDYEKHARVTRLVFATAWQVANQDERPRVTGAGFH